MSDEITMGVSFANDEYLNYSVMRKIKIGRAHV